MLYAMRACRHIHITPGAHTPLPIHRHLTRTDQFDRRWVEEQIFPLANRLRDENGGQELAKGKALFNLFYEPSFLTRVSFERAVRLLGGEAYFTEDASQFFPVRTPNYIDNTIAILASLHINIVVLRSSDEGVFQRAEEADAIPVINGGSLDDHPTQALADLYTITRELGGIDGARVAIAGRLEHRNVSALLRGLTLFKDVRVDLVPFSGQVDPAVAAYCESKSLRLTTYEDVKPLAEADVIYLNGPRTVAHVELLKSRNAFNLRIDEAFMARLKPDCIIMDPMQRSGDFSVEVDDRRVASYRQAENALFVRMAVLAELIGE